MSWRKIGLRVGIDVVVLPWINSGGVRRGKWSWREIPKHVPTMNLISHGKISWRAISRNFWRFFSLWPMF